MYSKCLAVEKLKSTCCELSIGKCLTVKWLVIHFRQLVSDRGFVVHLCDAAINLAPCVAN